MNKGDAQASAKHEGERKGEGEGEGNEAGHDAKPRSGGSSAGEPLDVHGQVWVLQSSLSDSECVSESVGNSLDRKRYLPRTRSSPELEPPVFPEAKISIMDDYFDAPAFVPTLPKPTHCNRPRHNFLFSSKPKDNNNSGGGQPVVDLEAKQREDEVDAVLQEEEPVDQRSLQSRLNEALWVQRMNAHANSARAGHDGGDDSDDEVLGGWEWGRKESVEVVVGGAAQEQAQAQDNKGGPQKHLGEAAELEFEFDYGGSSDDSDGGHDDDHHHRHHAHRHRAGHRGRAANRGGEVDLLGDHIENHIAGSGHVAGSGHMAGIGRSLVSAAQADFAARPQPFLANNNNSSSSSRGSRNSNGIGGEALARRHGHDELRDTLVLAPAFAHDPARPRMSPLATALNPPSLSPQSPSLLPDDAPLPLQLPWAKHAQVEVRVPPGPVGFKVSKTPPLRVLSLERLPNGKPSALEGHVHPGWVLTAIDDIDMTRATFAQFREAMVKGVRRERVLTFRRDVGRDDRGPNAPGPAPVAESRASYGFLASLSDTFRAAKEAAMAVGQGDASQGEEDGVGVGLSGFVFKSPKQWLQDDDGAGHEQAGGVTQKARRVFSGVVTAVGQVITDIEEHEKSKGQPLSEQGYYPAFPLV